MPPPWPPTSSIAERGTRAFKTQVPTMKGRRVVFALAPSFLEDVNLIFRLDEWTKRPLLSTVAITLQICSRRHSLVLISFDPNEMRMSFILMHKGEEGREIQRTTKTYMLSRIEPPRTGRAVTKDETFTEAVRIIAPEKLPDDRINQLTVRERAREFHSILGRFQKHKASFEARGVEFGGRVLLFGPPGTDFQSFVHHLATEVPLTLVTFTLEQAIASPVNAADTIKHSLEFARRNAPCLFRLNRIELLSSADAHISATLETEIERTSWDNEEVIVVGSTTQPAQVNQELLSIFNRTFLFETATTDDRTNCIERILKGWDGIELSVLVEMTRGWSFADVKHMAVSLLMQDSEAMGQLSKDQLQGWLERSGIHPVGNRRWVQGVAGRMKGEKPPRLEELEAEYPEGFLDQLYLMAVGDNYAETQRVIETLNSDLPLSSQDRGFLARYPFLLTGNPEDRLTRLLRAKKGNDRLRRIMGR